MSNFTTITSSVQSILMILLTIWLLYFCGGQLISIIDFAIISAVWSDPDGLKRRFAQLLSKVANFQLIGMALLAFYFCKKKFLIYGRIPDEELWRANLVYAGLLLVWVIYLGKRAR